MSEIINKVANSKIISFDMEEILPKENEIVTFDLTDYLFQGIVLKEMDFRSALKTFDWETYRNKHVLITCSSDAIVPIWSYMLVCSYLEGVAKVYGNTKETIFIETLKLAIEDLKTENDISESPLVIKGCSNISFKEALYLEATKQFLPLVKSIMYGEPCSTVPIYKRKRKK